MVRAILRLCNFLISCIEIFIQYPDHYNFSTADIEKISQEYLDCEAADKLIITTEKDAQRLKNSTFAASLARTLLYVLPVETAFAEDDKITLGL